MVHVTKTNAMKILRIITHPWIVISLYFIILITGKAIGGVYLLYLLMALPNGYIHSILGFLGPIMLLIAYYRINHHDILRKVISLLGIILMYSSLYYFFHNDRDHYNYGSFKTAAFWITFSIFSITALGLLVVDSATGKRRDW